MQRVIVSAAIRGRGAHDVLIMCVRHCDELSWALIEACYSPDTHLYTDKLEQGFVDNKGVFLTRTEAWQVAEAAGQIKRRVGGDTVDGGTLFSENLY